MQRRRISRRNEKRKSRNYKKYKSIRTVNRTNTTINKFIKRRNRKNMVARWAAHNERFHANGGVARLKIFINFALLNFT